MMLVHMMKNNYHFKSWFEGATDVCGVPSSPIELLILGSLRYIGRCWTFDCIEEATFISAKRHERFFHKFISFGSTVLFDMCVIT